MILRPDDYFAQGCGRCPRFATPDCSVRAWAPGLLALRRIAQDMGLQEVAKWVHPVYVHAGRNIAILGAFRGDFRISFFNAALLQDPGGLLERQGPNTQQPDCLRFEGPAAVLPLEPAIRAFLAQAMGHAETGLMPPKTANAVDLPPDLVKALDSDPTLAKAFAALTPGRQKSWALHIGSAKTLATRLARIDKARAPIIAGKGATER